MTNEFTDKIVIVTGASRGIGLAVAEYFLENGATVVCGVRHPKKLIFSKYKKDSDRILILPLDVTNETSIKSFVQKTIQKFGIIDILVNNAGVDQPRPLTEITAKHWNYVMGTNVTGLIFMSKYVVMEMLKRKHGVIINLSSIAGKEGVPYHSAYVASKHAVIGITKCLARELIPDGIRVNAVAPGLINTDMLQGFFKEFAQITHTNAKKELQKMIDLTPRGAMGKPADVAQLIGFLASDKATNIIGHTFNTDGGILQH